MEVLAGTPRRLLLGHRLPTSRSDGPQPAILLLALDLTEFG
jgi:hypothetical protein